MEELYISASNRIDMTKQAMLERMEEIQAYNSRIIGALLYFIAAVGLTNIFPIAFGYLSSQEVISAESKSEYEAGALLLLFVISAVIYFWPRKL